MWRRQWLVGGLAAAGLLAAGLTALPASGAGKVAAPRHAVKVDFGPRGVAPARGYVADIGQAFSRTRGYGWVKVSNGKPVSIVGTGVRRSSPRDRRLQTFLPMQAKTVAAWSVVMANGLYDVSVAVGDAAMTSSVDVVVAQPHKPQQVVLVGGFRPTKAHRFWSVTKRVRVSHGRLTLSPGSGRNTKIDFVVVKPVPPKPTPAPTTASPTSAPVTTTSPPTGPTTSPPTAGFVDDFTLGGTVSASCAVTGFDGVLPDTAGDQCSASHISFVPSGLRLTSTAGQLANDDQQNALYRAFDASGGSFTLTARVVGPVNQLTQNYQQVGAWFGPDQNNFVKVEAEHNGESTPHLTMFYRENGTAGIVGSVALSGLTSASTVDLVIKASERVLTAYYSLNGAALVQVGSAKTPAASANWFAAAGKAGVLVSNSGSSSSITATFSRLAVTLP